MFIPSQDNSLDPCSLLPYPSVSMFAMSFQNFFISPVSSMAQFKNENITEMEEMMFVRED